MRDVRPSAEQPFVAFATPLQGYMQARRDRDFAAMRRHMHPAEVTFGNAVCCWVYRTPTELEDAWDAQAPNWQAGAGFYDTRGIERDQGGVVSSRAPTHWQHNQAGSHDT